MITATRAKHRMSKKDKEKDKEGSRAAKSRDKDKDSVLDRNSDLKNAVAQIEKQFGEGAMLPLGRHHTNRTEGISTGSISLDIALGGVGLPRGRITEIFRAESSGKTTLALHVVAQAQRQGGIAAFVDAEHAMDPSWAK